MTPYLLAILPKDAAPVSEISGKSDLLSYLQNGGSFYLAPVSVCLLAAALILTAAGVLFFISSKEKKKK